MTAAWPTTTSRSQLSRLVPSLPSAASALVYSTDHRAYQEALAHSHGAEISVECPTGQSFERLSASASLQGMDIRVQARTPVRLHFRAPERRTLILCLAGSSQVRAGRRIYDLCAASSALFGLQGAGTAEMGLGASALVSFDPAILQATLRVIAGDERCALPDETLVGPGVMVRGGRHADLMSAIRLALSGFLPAATASDVVMRATALVALGASSGRERLSTTRDGDSAAEKARAYVHDNLGEEITLTGLERVAGVSRRTLQLAFSRSYGLSPMEYLREQRLLAARERLSGNAGASVTEVALECGFTHMSQFSMQFRRRFGLRPSEVARRGG